MSPETEQLLRLVRAAEEPTLADEERVLRALQAAVASGAGPSVNAQGVARDGWSGTLLAKLAAAGWKLGAVVTCLLATLAAVYLLGGTKQPVAVEAPRATLPAETQRERATLTPSLEPMSPQAEAAADPRPQPQGRAPRDARAAGRRQTGSSLRAEIALLERVQAALKRSDGASALRELDAHQTLDRALLAERRAARILALCLLGRVGEARRAAEEFATQHPNSPQREAIAGSCANSQRNQER